MHRDRGNHRVDGTNRKATIYDIARLSGASPSTVSAALGGKWKARRISESTVNTIRLIAEQQGYSPNLQARGLRQARSGLVGMIIAFHDNRFFSSLSQNFEAQARQRGLVPVIASSLRDPVEELRILETLISYAVDFVFIAGATDPDAITATCKAANMRHVFVDLPGSGAPSVTSDNYGGAAALTRVLLTGLPQGARPHFIGGCASDQATSRRIAAFRAETQAAGFSLSDDQIITCGYAPGSARRAVAALMDRCDGLPEALFINSLTVLEGLLGHFTTLPDTATEHTRFGCYDYDPFAAFLRFPVHMVRQNAAELIVKAYDLIDKPSRQVVEVPPDLIPPRTIFSSPFSEQG